MVHIHDIALTPKIYCPGVQPRRFTGIWHCQNPVKHVIYYGSTTLC